MQLLFLSGDMRMRIPFYQIALGLSLLLLQACAGSSAPSYEISPDSAYDRDMEGKSTGAFKIGNPYRVDGRWYKPKETYRFRQTGVASWYGPNFHGKLTANGEVYDQNALTAAHKTLQLPSIIRVTNLKNGRSVIVRVNDRGPFSKGRVLDMSRKGAEVLQYINQGTTRVQIEMLEKESRVVARMAKQGRSVDGVEIALNQGKSVESFFNMERPVVPSQPSIALEEPPVQLAQNQAVTPPSVQADSSDIQPVSLTAADLNVRSLESITANTAQVAPVQVQSAPINAPTVQAVQAPANVNVPAVVPGGYYVQAGSFSSLSNASAYAQRLKQFGQADVYPGQINDKLFYRVRLGPVNSVEQADQLLSGLHQAGETHSMIIRGQ